MEPITADEPLRRASIATATTNTTSEPEIIEKHQEDAPTASHALAEDSKDAAPEEKGASQIPHGDVEVRNLGWNDAASRVPMPLVGGLRNEELWALMRRFDKHVFHVRSIDEPPLGRLDMEIAADEEFSPEKLRAQLERLYVSVLVQVFALWKHVVRLRSWREARRTGAFLAVYALAWAVDMLAPALIAFAMVLVWSPRAREVCFPPAPPALIDPDTGGVQKPAAGVLASDDSATGAPEKHKGEAVELEAHNFVTSISTLVVSTAAGKHPQSDPYDDSAAPDPSEVTELATDARAKTVGREPGHEHDRTKKPVSHAVWDRARPAMHLVAEFVDLWERLGNALSPTAPFPEHRPKLALIGVLAPLLLGACFTSSYGLVKGVGFAAGFGLFGDPVITRGLRFLNRTYPRWEKYVELRNTILKGVPTNAQLTITLLRIGERNKAPLPPPPDSNVPPPMEPHPTAGQGLEHLEGATDAEIQAAIQPEPGAEIDELHEEKQSKHKKSHKLMGIFRGVTKGGVQTALTADKAKAAAGAHHARNRLGAVKALTAAPETGPVRFPARCGGKKGHAYITTTATTPAVSWTPGAVEDGDDAKDVRPAWTVAIGDIAELKKMGGLGWKTKIIVGWALGREVVDGLMIRTRDGRELLMTAIVARDQLFNRLISMGTQMWEAR